MSSKKIWQYPEATSITNDDYILMDSNTETGSQCLKANKIGAVHITKTVTERKVYKASDDNANGFSEVTVAVPYTDVHYDKDDIVSFVGEDLPLKSVTAYIEPQQDLHGYDAPWVGGAGKNKANPDLLLNGYTNPSNRKYDNTTMAKTQFVKTEGLSTITISATNGNRCYVCYYNDIPNVGDEASTNVTQVATSLPQTITVDSSYTYVAIQVCYNSSGANVSNVQVESGNQATTFAPYSNECPISGWDEVNVGVTSKNLVNWKWNIFNDGKMEIFLKGGTYTLSAESTLINGNAYIRGTKPNGEYVSREELGLTDWGASSTSGVYYGGGGQQTYTFKVPNGGAKIEFGKLNNNGTISAQLEFGSSASDFEPYNGQTITIDLDGTRYGGKVDLVSGVLTVTHENADLPSLSWGKSTNTANIYFYVLYTSGANGTYNEPATNVMSNIYITKSRNSVTNTQGTVGISAEANALYIADGRFDDYTVAQFKEAMSDVQLLLPLATPLTIQLTPTQVNSLMGVNNIWADCGEIAVEWQTLYVTPTT